MTNRADTDLKKPADLYLHTFFKDGAYPGSAELGLSLSWALLFEINYHYI